MSAAHVKTYTNKTWRNTIKRHKWKPAKYFVPGNASEISEIVREAENNEKKIRAVGSGHSFSNVAILDDGNYLIDMSRLDTVNEVDPVLLQPSVRDSPIVYAGAGTTVRDLNKGLDRLHYSIVNMGGIDHQTISGAISTGTHGTGMGVPAIHGMVRAIQLVTHGGRMLQLEPDSGITDPGLTSFGDWEIVRDDDVFNAALVSLGALGIICGYILQVDKEYWLKEIKTMMLWSEVKPRLEDRSLLKHNRGCMVQINPYSGLNREDPGDHSCLVVTHNPRFTKPRIGWFARMRNVLGSIATNVPVIRWIVYRVLLSRIRYNLIKMPKSLETTIRAQEDKSYINTAHKVLAQGAAYVKERAYDCELAFDMKDNIYIEVVDALIRNAKKLKKQGYYHTSPIGLRFVKRSEALITPEYHRDVCYVDTPMLLNAKGEQEVIMACEKLMFDLGGIPHWGKYNDILIENKDRLEEIHTGLRKWKEVVRKFNPNGTFNSKFMDKLNLSP